MHLPVLRYIDKRIFASFSGMSSKRSARDAWMVILGFMMSLALAYGIFFAFYQPEIYRLQDEVRSREKLCEPQALMHYLADSSLHYIKQKHPEVASTVPKTLAWQGGRTTPEGPVGHETYTYKASGWKTTIEWNITPPENFTYTVTVEHDNLLWKGKILSGDIVETSFKK